MEDGGSDAYEPTIDEELAEQDKGCAGVYSFHTIKYRLERIEYDKLHPPGSEFGELPD